MLGKMAKLMLSILGIVLFLFFLYIVLKSFFVVVKNRSRRNHSLKFKWKHKLYHLRNVRYIKPVEFVKWVVIDIFRGKDKLKLFGIWAFTGYYGEGKTMGCVQFAKHLQKTYPHRNIKIYSNIDVKGQEKRLSSWEDILYLPPNSIVIYDESQADWSCNMGVGSFPEDLLRRITQMRKKQLALFMTSPRFNRMNINIRESVNFVIECKNIFGLDRWFRYVFYRAEDYEQYAENKIKLAMNKYLDMSVVVQDKDYKLYNTVEIVESIKGEEIKPKKNDVIKIQDYLKSFRNEIVKEVEGKIRLLEGKIK